MNFNQSRRGFFDRVILILLSWVATGATASLAAGGGNVGTDHQIIHLGGSETIVAFTDVRGDHRRRVYLQKLNSSGQSQWTTNGLQISDFNSYSPQLVSDGSNGVVLVWQEQRPNEPWQVYAQRVSNTTGLAQWSPGGIRVCTAPTEQKDPQIVSDGSGGAIVCWVNNRVVERRLYAQRFDGDGNRLWPDSGVEVSTLAAVGIRRPHLVSDNNGGAIAVWERHHFVQPESKSSVYAQRIDSAGSNLWNSGTEVTIATSPVNGTQEGEDTHRLEDVTSDGFGGVIAAWSGWGAADRDLLAKRLDNSGSELWAVTVSAAVGDQHNASIDSAGSSGTCIVWEDTRGGSTDLYGQRIDSAGNPQWTADGKVIVGSAALRDSPQVYVENITNNFVLWQQSGAAYLQKLAASGNNAPGWPSEGLALTTNVNWQNAPRAVLNGSNGLIGLWQDKPANGFGLAAQRISSTANRLWGATGKTVVDATNTSAHTCWVRLGFEDLADSTIVSDQYQQCGVTFQEFGPNGGISFFGSQLPPIGDEFNNWQNYPPIEMGDLSMPYTPFTEPRYINLDQPASYVSLWYTMGHTFLRGKIKAYDGLNVTGSVLFDQQLSFNPGTNNFLEINTGTYNIQSIQITTVADRILIDDLIIDSAPNPLGGYLDISSELDATAPPAAFLDGNPSYLGDYAGASPTNLISVSEGTHLVSLYSPGYEWHQEYVEILLGQTTMVHAVMSPIIVPYFDDETFLQADGSALDTGSNTSPCMADWDTDGRKDLIVGNAAGDVLLYANLGTDADPLFAAGLTILTNTGANASPVVIDFYSDEKNDLVVGYGDGTVKVFYNQGTRTVPDFSGSPYDSTLVTAPSSNAVPFLVDWDNDHKKDLLVGCQDGNVYLYLNQRLDASPDYTGVTPTNVATVASNAAPVAVLDWDGDGNKDLVVGDGAGYVNLFLNQGTDAAPVFSTSTRLQTLAGVDINVGSMARPLVADYSHDGLKDLLIGRGDGRVSLYAMPGAPRLTITLTATNTVLVSWPSPAPGFNLEQNTDLNPTNWVSAPAPTDDGTNKFIVVDPPADSRFYRLHRP